MKIKNTQQQLHSSCQAPNAKNRQQTARKQQTSRQASKKASTVATPARNIGNATSNGSILFVYLRYQDQCSKSNSYSPDLSALLICLRLKFPGPKKRAPF